MRTKVIANHVGCLQSFEVNVEQHATRGLYLLHAEQSHQKLHQKLLEGTKEGLTRGVMWMSHAQARTHHGGHVIVKYPGGALHTADDEC